MKLPSYKRPSLPPPQALRDRTASLREKNDALAASLGEPSTSVRPRGPALSPAALAPAIRAQNDARSAHQQEQDNGRAELMRVFDDMHRQRPSPQDREMFLAAMREYLEALVAANPAGRIDALRAMRENVEAMRRYQEGR